MFTYHYAFLSVAVAFAGLGFGGIISHLIQVKHSLKKIFDVLAIICFMFAVVLVTSTIIALYASLTDAVAIAIPKNPYMLMRGK